MIRCCGQAPNSIQTSRHTSTLHLHPTYLGLPPVQPLRTVGQHRWAIFLPRQTAMSHSRHALRLAGHINQLHFNVRRTTIRSLPRQQSQSPQRIRLYSSKPSEPLVSVRRTPLTGNAAEKRQTPIPYIRLSIGLVFLGAIIFSMVSFCPLPHQRPLTNPLATSRPPSEEELPIFSNLPPSPTETPPANEKVE